MIKESVNPETRGEHSEKAHKRAEAEGARNTDRNHFEEFNLSIVTSTPDRNGVRHYNPDWHPKVGEKPHGTKLTITGLGSVDFPVHNGELPAAPEQEYSEALLEEVNTKRKMRDPGEGKTQELSYVVVNEKVLKDNPDQAVTVYSLPWINYHHDGKEADYRLLEMGRQMSDRAVISFEPPGVGDSDPMTKEQKSTRAKDSHFEIARTQLRMLEKMFEEKGITDKKINLAGFSMGAFGSLAMATLAHEFDIKVEHLTLVELPGVSSMKAIDLALKEMKEGNDLNLYHSSPADPVMWEGTGFKDPATDREGQDESPWQLLKIIWSRDKWLRYGRSMHKATAEDRLRTVLDAQPDVQISLIQGGRSTVSPLEPVKAMHARLKTELDAKPEEQCKKNRLSLVVFPGEGHMTNVQPKRFASLLKSELDGTFLPDVPVAA